MIVCAAGGPNFRPPPQKILLTAWRSAADARSVTLPRVSPLPVVTKFVTIKVVAGSGTVDVRASLERLALRLEEVHEQDPANARAAEVLLAALLALGGPHPEVF